MQVPACMSSPTRLTAAARHRTTSDRVSNSQRPIWEAKSPTGVLPPRLNGSHSYSSTSNLRSWQYSNFPRLSLIGVICDDLNSIIPLRNSVKKRATLLLLM